MFGRLLRTWKRRVGVIGAGERFSRSRSGATAVEFAIVMVPFMFVLMSVFEIGLIMYTESLVTGKSAVLGREIRVNNFRSTTAQDARDFFCSGNFLPSCETRLHINVTTLQAGTPLPPAIDADGAFALGPDSFDTGNPNDIVVMRFFYEYEFINLAVREVMKNLSNNRRLIESATAFRIE